jgi:hypothetical protein
VIDVISSRSATATITATVQTISQPLVLIASQQLVGELNPDQQLVLQATITLATTGSFAWSVNDTSLVLAKSALTPISSSR